jgi:hypothetical protein
MRGLRHRDTVCPGGFTAGKDDLGVSPDVSKQAEVRLVANA